MKILPVLVCVLLHGFYSQVVYEVITLRKEGVDAPLTFRNVLADHEFPVGAHVIYRVELSAVSIGYSASLL